MPENRYGHLRLVDANGSLTPILDQAASEREKLLELGFGLTEMTPEMARELLRQVAHTDKAAPGAGPAIRLAHVVTTPLPDRVGRKGPPILRLIEDGGDGSVG
jgi:hypothetical protein